MITKVVLYKPNVYDEHKYIFKQRIVLRAVFYSCEKNCFHSEYNLVLIFNYSNNPKGSFRGQYMAAFQN